MFGEALEAVLAFALFGVFLIAVTCVPVWLWRSIVARREEAMLRQLAHEHGVEIMDLDTDTLSDRQAEALANYAFRKLSDQ